VGLAQSSARPNLGTPSRGEEFHAWGRVCVLQSYTTEVQARHFTHGQPDALTPPRLAKSLNAIELQIMTAESKDVSPNRNDLSVGMFSSNYRYSLRWKSGLWWYLLVERSVFVMSPGTPPNTHLLAGPTGHTNNPTVLGTPRETASSSGAPAMRRHSTRG
jgi:hypothetical protein